METRVYTKEEITEIIRISTLKTVEYLESIGYIIRDDNEEE